MLSSIYLFDLSLVVLFFKIARLSSLQDCCNLEIRPPKQDCKIARLQDCKIARLQDNLEIKQDCKIARLTFLVSLEIKQDCKIVNS